MPGYRQIYRGNPEQKLYYLVKNFSGGMNTSDVDDEVRDNEFRELKNVELSTRGLLQNRKGFGELELLNELLAPLNIPSGHVSLLKVVKNKNSALRKIVESTDLNYFNTTYALQEMELQILILIDNKLYLIKVEKEAGNEISTSISVILTLATVNSYKDRVNTIETIDYAQFVYFSTSDISSELEGIIKYDVDKEEAELIDKENAYKPSAYEVISSQDLKGFNVIAENPLQWIRPSETGFREVLGLFLTKDGKYLTKIPTDGVFDVNVVYSGSDIDPHEIELSFKDINNRKVGHFVLNTVDNGGIFTYSVELNLRTNISSVTIDAIKRPIVIVNTRTFDNYLELNTNDIIIARDESAFYERKSTGEGYNSNDYTRNSPIIDKIRVENLTNPTNQVLLNDALINQIIIDWEGNYLTSMLFPEQYYTLVGDEINGEYQLNGFIEIFDATSSVLVEVIAGFRAFDYQYQYHNSTIIKKIGTVEQYANLPDYSNIPSYGIDVYYVRDTNQYYRFIDFGSYQTWMRSVAIAKTIGDIILEDGDVVYESASQKYYVRENSTFRQILPTSYDRIFNTGTFDLLPTVGEPDVLYFTIDDSRFYRWVGLEYVEVEELVFDYDPIVPLLGQYFDIGDTLNQDEIENIDLKDVNITMIENRLVLYKGNTIWFSDLYKFDYFPNLNFHILPLELSDEIVAIKFFRGSHIIFTKDTIWKMTGTWGNEMNIQIINGYIGAISPRSIRSIENSLFFMSREGLYRLMANYYADGLENVSRVDNLIRDLIPKDEDLDSILYNSQYWLLTQDNEDFDSVKYYYSIDLEKASKHPFTIDKYSIKPDLFMQFDSALYTIKNGKFYLFDKGYTDFGDSYETVIQTARLSLDYPTHDKKYKNIYIKTLAPSLEVVPLYLTVEVDGYKLIDPLEYTVELNEEGQIVYTPAYTNAEATLITQTFFLTESQIATYTPGALGNFEVGETMLGGSNEQTHKVVISGKGKNIALRIVSDKSDYFGLTDIGYLHKLGKVRENR